MGQLAFLRKGDTLRSRQRLISVMGTCCVDPPLRISQLVIDKQAYEASLSAVC